MTAANVRLLDTRMYSRNQRRLQAIVAQLRLLEVHGHPSVRATPDWRVRTLRRVRRKWEAVARATSVLPEDHVLHSALDRAIVDVQQSLGRLRQSA